MALRVLHLSTYDANGGAARAAYALHRAMLSQGLDSRMLVAKKETSDPTVTQGNANRFRITSELDRRLWKLQRSPVTTWRSPARFASLSADQINRTSADVVNLHWVTDGFLSVEEIGKIDKPIVWSMYDMWPFAGTEHYGADTENARWHSGYTKANRPTTESGFDLDRWAYERKLEHWRTRTNPFHMVPASTWLTDATKASALMRDWPITRIPHVIDTDVFAPMDKADARAQLRLPQDRPTIVFLASAGITDHRKGWDLLEQALPTIKQAHPTIQVIVVGPVPDADAQHTAERNAQATIHWHGTVDTSQALRTLYCAADVVAVPSREDNMPLTAMEAQSCGRPVVGFRIGGLPDIVEDGATGYLAAFGGQGNPTVALQSALAQALTDADAGFRARKRALANWSPQSVVPQYVQLFAVDHHG